MTFFLKLKLNYLSKMHGYPQFCFWIPRVLTKIYFLRIVSNIRYSDFLSVMLTNTGIFLRGLKLSGESDLSKYSWYPKRKLGVTMHF